MPASPVTAAPFIPVKPLISLDSGGGNTVSFECASESVEVSVEQDENTYETFCGTYTNYKPEQWTVTASVFQSYGATGLWTLVRPLVGPARAFTFQPDFTLPVSVTNPKMSGTAIVKAFPFYSGSPGEPQAFDLVLAVQGTPTFAIA